MCNLGRLIARRTPREWGSSTSPDPSPTAPRQRAAAVAASDSYAGYRWLRAHRPVFYEENAKVWLLTRYDHCAAVLRDPRFSATAGQARRSRGDRLPVSMLNSDGAEHARLRGPVSRVFAPRQLDELRPLVRELVEHGLAHLDRRDEVDLLSDFAGPFALDVIARLLGVPDDHLSTFTEMAHRVAINLDPLADPASALAGRRAAEELALQLDSWLGDGGAGWVVDPLVAATRRGELSRQEALATLVLFVIGGLDPLTHLVGNGILTLLRHPDQLDLLRSRPDLAGRAVQELLRFEAPIPFTARVTIRDVEVGRWALPAGQTVVVVLAAANRDPEVFRLPDRLDVARKDPTPLTFGAGPHVCVAAPLARLCAELAIPALLRRFPAIRLASPRPSWRPVPVPRGLLALPVRLSPM